MQNSLTPHSRISLSLSASGAVRLVGGPSRCSGRLEVQSAQSWLSVYLSYFSREAALVTCRNLNCGFLHEYFGRYDTYFQSTEHIWNSTFNCEGTEKHLMDCPSPPLNITHGELSERVIVYVTCRGNNQGVCVSQYVSQQSIEVSFDIYSHICTSDCRAMEKIKHALFKLPNVFKFPCNIIWKQKFLIKNRILLHKFATSEYCLNLLQIYKLFLKGLLAGIILHITCNDFF